MCDATSGFCPLLTLYCILTLTMLRGFVLAARGNHIMAATCPPPIDNLSLFFSLSLRCVLGQCLSPKERIHTDVAGPRSNTICKSGEALAPICMKHQTINTENDNMSQQTTCCRMSKGKHLYVSREWPYSKLNRKMVLTASHCLPDVFLSTSL